MQIPQGYRDVEKQASVSSAIACLLSPIALMAGILGAWRFFSERGMAGDFVIAEGLFSHWQVWVGLAVVLRMGSAFLDRPMSE